MKIPTISLILADRTRHSFYSFWTILPPDRIDLPHLFDVPTHDGLTAAPEVAAGECGPAAVGVGPVVVAVVIGGGEADEASGGAGLDAQAGSEN